jgi:serine phosphatase RsbU (regulator of sigma subunit)
MNASPNDFWLILVEQDSEMLQSDESLTTPTQVPGVKVRVSQVDPIIEYMKAHPDVVKIDEIHGISPLVSKLKKSGVIYTLPLFKQGELIGLFNIANQLGEHSNDINNRLMIDPAIRAATILRIAQLYRQESVYSFKNEKRERDTQIARIIQDNLTSRENPDISGWKLLSYSQAAETVGGDFFDFTKLPDGRIAIVIGDVTDNAIPAALVMASTKLILRDEVMNSSFPGRVLGRINNFLCEDIPSNMFVTCFCAFLDPNNGSLSYANAGHNLPICRRHYGVEVLHAEGMPLGLFHDMEYDEGVTILEPGDTLLLYSDGFVEAHNKSRELFGSRQLRELLGDYRLDDGLFEFLMSKLEDFTGDTWEQEDDISLLMIRRDQRSTGSAKNTNSQELQEKSWRILGEFTLPSEPGNERNASEKVVEYLRDVPLVNLR